MAKRKAVAALAVVVILLASVTASGQVRLEGNLAWPLTIGISSNSTLFGSTGTSVDISKYYFLVPDFRAYYQFGDGLIDGGIGIRLPTLILISAFYPEAFVELNLKPLVLEATLGGLLFGYFGFGTAGFTAQPILTSDINASLQVVQWFRIGGGVYLLMPADSTFSQNFIYVGYISVRFVFLLK